MPTFARNELTVADDDYSPALTFDYDQPSRKLTFDVRNGDVYLQVRELLHGSYGGPGGDEMLLAAGFHGRTFTTTVYGLRLRAAAPVPAPPPVVSFTYYA